MSCEKKCGPDMEYRFVDSTEVPVKRGICQCVEDSCKYKYTIDGEPRCWQSPEPKTFANRIKDYFNEKKMPEVGVIVANHYLSLE